jgi:hypothetical protein
MKTIEYQGKKVIVLDEYEPDDVPQMTIEDAIFEAIALHTPFTVEQLRYAYEDSFDNLLKAVAMAQEQGSDNLVRCMRSVLMDKHSAWRETA